jgi:cytoskeleton protein RodZ
MPSIGPLLSERREAMGVTLAEAEVATRIRQKYLAAIERDEWDLLPGEVVGRGFLRNYATYLGLDPTEMIDRRRAIADDSLAAVLANTSAATDLPPERKVDYRPKDVALKDEGDEMESPRQINLTPFFVVFATVAVVALLVWGFTQFSNQLEEMTAAVQRQATVWQEQLTAAVAQPTTAATAASAAAPVATSAPTPTVEATPALSAAAAPVAPVTDATADAVAQPTPTVEAPSLLGLLPTPTPGVEPPAAAVPVEPTPAPPAPVTATVLLGANLRSGPSTDFGIVGAAQQGEAVTLVGRNADSTWFQTAAGAWIFGQLLENVPTDLPVVETPALPAAPAAEPPAQQG